MSVRLVVAITDFEWFRFLSSRPGLQEANFWSPSAKAFRALQPGELFLFKLHSPRDFIVGGGIFAHATEMPCSMAWQAFGEANGAGSLEEMRRRVLKYRRGDAGAAADLRIGCRILTQPVLFPEEAWFPAPRDWAPNIVSFKGYDAAEDAIGRELWDAFTERAAEAATLEDSPEARFGSPRLVTPRLGQGAFRSVVTDLYGRRCALTGERTLPALDAAHIRPYADGGARDPRNGLLLRKDVHSLFDAGYVTVGPDYRFEVSRRIREEFENGRHYYELQGRRIHVANDPASQPDASVLRWHNEERFLG